MLRVAIWADDALRCIEASEPELVIFIEADIDGRRDIPRVGKNIEEVDPRSGIR